MRPVPAVAAGIGIGTVIDQPVGSEASTLTTNFLLTGLTLYAMPSLAGTDTPGAVLTR